jgi:hypothetical protein
MANPSMSAQAENAYLQSMIQSYEAYFEGRDVGSQEANAENPYPQVDQKQDDMPSPHAMWQDGYNESKQLQATNKALSVASTMVQAMKELNNMAAGE